VQAAVLEVHSLATSTLGPVRMEWVYDGQRAWIVQLHSGVSPSAGRVIFPGDPEQWQRFPIENGIDALRDLIATRPTGVVLRGCVGMTSHMADLLRRAEIPSRLEPPSGR